MFITVGAGFVVGGLTRPDEWYRSLAKPAFNPHDWVFAPVWTVIYVLIAAAGRRICNREPRLRRLWIAQPVLNFAWTPLFFTAHSIPLSVATIVLVLAVVLAFLVLAARPDRISAMLFVPYALWVTLATVLTTAIEIQNMMFSAEQRI